MPSKNVVYWVCFLAVFSASGCDERSDEANPPDDSSNDRSENSSSTKPPISFSADDADTGVTAAPPLNPDADAEELADDEGEPLFDPEFEQETTLRVQTFMQEVEAGRLAMIGEFDGSYEDAALVKRLLEQDISLSLKKEMLGTLVNGDYEDIAAALHIAISSSEKELVLAAIEIMEVSGSPDDIPRLQQIVAVSPDTEIRDSALKAIQALQE